MAKTSIRTASKSAWDRIREVPGFVAAVIALISVMISASIFVVSYFATRGQLLTVNCFYENVTNSLSAQIEQIALYNQYNVMTAQLIEQQNRLDAAPQDNALELQVIETKRKMDVAFQRIEASKIESRNALAAKDDCLKKGSEL
jgi:hypothetical protein